MAPQSAGGAPRPRGVTGDGGPPRVRARVQFRGAMAKASATAAAAVLATATAPACAFSVARGGRVRRCVRRRSTRRCARLVGAVGVAGVMGAANAAAWPAGVVTAATAHAVLAVGAYCVRRGTFHGLAPADVLRMHIAPLLGARTHEGRAYTGGGRRAWAAARSLLWVAWCATLWPAAEALLMLAAAASAARGARPRRKLAALFYDYPGANGCGMIIEERTAQQAGHEYFADGAAAGRRRAQLLRLDWHRFKLCSLPVPSKPRSRGSEPRQHRAVHVNLPHLDLPRAGVEHWPWRQLAKRALARGAPGRA